MSNSPTEEVYALGNNLEKNTFNIVEARTRVRNVCLLIIITFC